MNETISKKDREKGLKDGMQSALENKYIEEYLQTKGYQSADLKGLPEKKVKQLMKEACTYASLKLAEVEARSRFSKKISGPS